MIPIERRPLVYIASPYTHGDAALNARSQCALWDELLSDGVVLPLAPLWSHFQHCIFPRAYADWVAYDLALLPRCDALLRVPAEYLAMRYRVDRSSGADGEVEEMRRIGRPVFFGKPELYEWARVWADIRNT
jgi:hypothetical protein